jgi:hypothetical protein
MTRLQLMYFVLLLSGKFTLTQAQLPSFDLIVYPNGYKGHIAISSSRKEDFFFLGGETKLTIKPSGDAYYLNTGATIGGCSDTQISYIYLFFSKSGLLDSICPKECATIGKDRKSITFNTAPITIDPGAFNRAWYPSFGVHNSVPKGHYYGKQTVHLIKGQTYTVGDSDAVLVGNCDSNAVSLYYAFKFTVDTIGQVTLMGKNKASATASKKTLRFKTVCVDIDPLEISEGHTLYIRTPKPQQPIEITKKTKFQFIRAILNYVYWLNPDGTENIFYFMPM